MACLSNPKAFSTDTSSYPTRSSRNLSGVIASMEMQIWSSPASMSSREFLHVIAELHQNPCQTNQPPTSATTPPLTRLAQREKLTTPRVLTKPSTKPVNVPAKSISRQWPMA